MDEIPSLKNIKLLPPHEQQVVLKLMDKRDHAAAIRSARGGFGGYTNHMWPSFIEGRHHRIMDEAFDRVLAGTCKRLIINLGPRFTKSEKSSWLLPSKFIGMNPDKKIIQTSHTATLAEGFGRKVRNTVATARYQEVYPKTKLMADSKAAGRWATSEGGTYLAIGVGGKLAGYGADLLLIDDPHSEQDYMRALGGDSSAFDDVFEWYQTGPRQRLQPNAAIVIVMTRWHKRDLTGRLIKRMTSGKGSDQWEVIEFPAILNEKSLWPEFWPLEELEATRAELSVAQWNAQYLQNPTSEEGALVKRESWKIWDKDEPPECEYIIQCWDTAYLAKQKSDFSACITWGIFYLEDTDTGVNIANIILLDAYRAKLEFPALKAKAFEMWTDRQPDSFIIESKASGWPLIFELRQMGVPVTDFTPVRGSKANPNDKTARVNGITDMFQSGIVWCPDTRWSDEVREEYAAFPFGDNDDYVDAGTIGLTRFRQGGFIPLATDEDDQPIDRRTFSPY